VCSQKVAVEVIKKMTPETVFLERPPTNLVERLWLPQISGVKKML